MLTPVDALEVCNVAGLLSLFLVCFGLLLYLFVLLCEWYDRHWPLKPKADNQLKNQ